MQDVKIRQLVYFALKTLRDADVHFFLNNSLETSDPVFPGQY